VLEIVVTVSKRIVPSVTVALMEALNKLLQNSMVFLTNQVLMNLQRRSQLKDIHLVEIKISEIENLELWEHHQIITGEITAQMGTSLKEMKMK
jgi:hypothetical protein